MDQHTCDLEAEALAPDDAIDIQHDILREHGVSLQYKQVWLGKEIARVILRENEVANYDLLV